MEKLFFLNIQCQVNGQKISAVRLNLVLSPVLEEFLLQHDSPRRIHIQFPELQYIDLHFLEYWLQLQKEFKKSPIILNAPFSSDFLSFLGKIPCQIALPNHPPQKIQFSNKNYLPKTFIDFAHSLLSLDINDHSYLFSGFPSLIWHEKYISSVIPLLEKNLLDDLYANKQCSLPIAESGFLISELQKKSSPIQKYISAPTIIESEHIIPVFEFQYNKQEQKYELSLFLEAQISENKKERFPLNLESTRKFLKNNQSFVLNGLKNTSLVIQKEHYIRPQIQKIIEISFQKFYMIMGEIEDNKIITKDRSNFFEEFLPAVAKDVELYRSRKKNKLQFILGSEKASIYLKKNEQSTPLIGSIDWLSINFEYQQQGIKLSLTELEKIIHQGFLETENQLISLSEEELNPLKKLLEIRKNISHQDFQIQASFLPWLLQLYPQAQIPEEWKELQDFINKGDLPHLELNTNALYPLRDYQKIGVERLSLLNKFGFGMILADEMGLGKTLQVLTLLDLYHKKGKILVVTPSALIFNWEMEIEKFYPNRFRTLIIHGTKQNRDFKLKNLGEYDIIITSYHMLGFDLDHYQNEEFDFLIIDEAQHIKNRNSKRSKNVKQIKAYSRIAVSGTPLENNISELWSIFDFVMPNFLGTYKQFQRNFEDPLQRFDSNLRKETLEKLQQICSPFIIRRTKDTVYKELPPKIEQTILTELTDKQKSLYLKTLDSVRTQFESIIQENRFHNKHIDFLSALTKLRQIVLHPGLIYPELTMQDPELISSKLTTLIELLEESLESNHRILVFSQFVSMLEIIKSELIKRNIPFSYIDGHTKNRVQASEDFNQGDIPVFLISLRAGGVGLNLTGADTVILFDPWWNPAVENQAIDRAHRIGQQKTVNIYKIMTKGTIEEKIYNLQQKKNYIFDNIMQENSNLGAFSAEELLSLISPIDSEL